MKVIDGHTHVLPSPNIGKERNILAHDVRAIFRSYCDRLEQAEVDHAISILLDEHFLEQDEAVDAMLEVKRESEKFSPVFLIEPRSSDATALIDQIADIGGLGVKFHSHIQELGTMDIPQIKDVLSLIEDRNLLTIVDSNFAGEHLYDYNGVEFGHTIAQQIDSPILLAHAGNINFLEAFATARAFENVWLGTSFTLPYFGGSSVGQDIAFAMDKMDMEKWVWGSDVPYNDQIDSKSRMKRFLQRHDLEQFQEDLFFENAMELFRTVDTSVPSV